MKKKFEMEVTGPTDSDLKVIQELEKAEKKRKMLAEENSRRNINAKPMPVMNRAYGES